MTRRIQRAFQRAQREERAALIPYITAGDPEPEATPGIMHGLVAGGADIIELGVPFSDPMADGPVIQRAMERALERGTTLARCLEAVRVFREDDTHTAVLLFGYANPLHRRGYEAACSDAAAAGVDGLLVVDMPPEESAELVSVARRHGLDWIPLSTPTTPAERLRRIVEGASGFIYVVSVAGVTGAALGSWEDLSRRVEEVRQASSVPVAVGFGVRTPGDAQKIASFADGVVVGSALIEAIDDGDPSGAAQRAEAFLSSLVA